MAASVVASVALPISNNFSFAPSMDAYGKLSEYGKLGAWSPLSLFALGEQGAWYDPSDLSTMFQDSAGTTPVTADGQPVGLILDKSKGLVLGPELVTNGGFDVGTGWSLTNSTISGGKLVCNAVGSVFLATQSVAFTYPKSYELNVVISGLVSGNCTVVFGVGTNVSSSAMTSNGTYKFIIASGSGNSELRILSSGSGFVGNVDSISVKELAGNHASQATAAARPLYKTDGTYHWLQFDGIDDSLSTAAIDFSTTDKMSIFSGVYVTGGINRGICGFGGGGNSFNSLTTATTIFRTTALGTTGSAQTTVTIAAQKNVVTQQLDLAVSSANLATKARVNGVTPTPTVHTDTLVAGSSFGSYALTLGDWIGFVLQGNIYSLIVRGALSTTQKITDTETWVNQRTGAY